MTNTKIEIIAWITTYIILFSMYILDELGKLKSTFALIFVILLTVLYLCLGLHLISRVIFA